MQGADIEVLVKTADLLVKYGFLGVGVVLLGIAYGVYKRLGLKIPGVIVGGLGIVFIVTFGVFDIVQKYFPNLISSNRVFLSGVVLGLPNGFQTQIASDSRKAGAAYLKREIDPQSGALNNFYFLLFATQPPGCLAVAINNNDPNSEAGSSAFNISPITPDDLKTNASLVAHAEKNDKGFRLKVWREAGDQQVGEAHVFTRLSDSDPSCAIGANRAAPAARTSFLDGIVSRAFAQNSPSSKDISVRLKSDDLLVRRDARIDLSKQENSVDATRDLLTSDDYRLQLGALVALSLLPVSERQKLPADIMEMVNKFKINKDPTIRETAARVDRGH